MEISLRSAIADSQVAIRQSLSDGQWSTIVAEQRANCTSSAAPTTRWQSVSNEILPKSVVAPFIQFAKHGSFHRFVNLRRDASISVARNCTSTIVSSIYPLCTGEHLCVREYHKTYRFAWYHYRLCCTMGRRSHIRKRAVRRQSQAAAVQRDRRAINAAA